MPTYRYSCQACGHELEEFQSMTAAPLRRCPECGKSKLQRLIGAGAGVIFRGSGFYSTDYRAPAPAQPSAAKDEGASRKDAGSAGDAGTCGKDVCKQNGCQGGAKDARDGG
jgi:putative FmdB family regulatory protein